MEFLDLLWCSAYLVVLAGLCGYGLHRYHLLYLFFRHRGNCPQPRAHFDALPAVTIQLPVLNERYVVRRLLHAVARLDYPRENLQIQILDDSTDETLEICEMEARRLRAQGFDISVMHRESRPGYKAGALAAGMRTARGEFFLILDADFVPQPGMLHEMIHYFTDPEIGMVQARWGHLNEETNLLTKLQAILLNGHFVVEQTARFLSGRFVNFNGTAGIWRRRCIEGGGGWQHDTLTEDVDLSYRAQLAGWKFVYLNEVSAPAELPGDMAGYKSQQHRWSKGSVQTLKKLLGHIWRSDQPLRIKLEATAHLGANLNYLLVGVLCLLMLPGTRSGWISRDVVVILSGAGVAMISLSVMMFYLCSERWLHPKTWPRQMLLLPGVLALGIGMSVNNSRAVLEALCNRHSPFVRTPKYGLEGHRSGRDRRKGLAPGYRAVAQALVPAIELVMSGYFAALAVQALHNRLWGAVPFLLLFFLGFLYVSLATVLPWAGTAGFPRRKGRASEAADKKPDRNLQDAETS